MNDWILVFNATFNNISAISWRPVLVVEEAGVNLNKICRSIVKVYRRISHKIFYTKKRFHFFESFYKQLRPNVVVPFIDIDIDRITDNHCLKWALMYMYKGINFVSVFTICNVFIGFLECYDSVVFLIFHFIDNHNTWYGIHTAMLVLVMFKWHHH